MLSRSQRASHFSFISFLLDITCCSFSLICREGERTAQALVTLPSPLPPLPPLCESVHREILQRTLGLATQT